MTHSNTIFTSKYIYSPITKYHKINAYTKVHCTFSILMFVIYINSNKIIYFMLILLLITNIHMMSQSRYSHWLYYIKNGTSFTIYLITMNMLVNRKSSYNNKIQFCKLTLTFFFKVSKIHFNENILELKYYSLVYLLPNYIFRLTLIYIILNNTINLIFFCTKYETILEIMTGNLAKINKIIKLRNTDYIIDLFLGYQFIQELILNLMEINCGVRIKNIKLTNKNKISFNIIIVKYLTIFTTNHNQNSLTLWNRDISHKDFNNFKICY
uniref:Uncharacterized protein n=1 Tax=Laurencieae sp. TaxID=2007162 RepID=A0A1Z1M291_9FLOR|nr:hypothetical protein [Laurencieae sp.]